MTSNRHHKYCYYPSVPPPIYVVITCFLLQAVRGDAPPLIDTSSLPVEHRAVYGAPLPGPPAPHGQYGAPGPDEPWPLATPDQPQIKHLQVQCEKTHMRVNIEFDRPFYGMIFSKGYYSDHHCVHLKPGSGHLSATFEIFLNSCGMSSSGNHVAAGGYNTPSGSYVENTIIIQYDPYVQEVWDQARKLRCTWYDFYEKAVTFRPFQVDMLHAVTANFLGDNLQCWMQIQVGKGPWASEVSGIVKIGQTMTMVLAIKDDENKFDMLVRNCVAHDGKRAPIQLVDQHGCVVRPKIMSKFQKIKNFGPSASVVSFAYFQAFKFPDSMNVHFQCVIQVCRYNCPEPKCAGDYLLNQLDGLGGGGGGDYVNHLAVGGGGVGPPPVGHGDYNLPPPPPQLALPGGPGVVGAAGYPDFPPSPVGGPAYPDPRHPSGPAGAYSEPKPEIVPAPSTSPNYTTNPSSPAPQKISPNNANGNGNNNNNNNNLNNNNNNNNNNIDDDFNLPPPPLPGQSASYTTVKRKGTITDEESNLMTLGGRPRSVELEDIEGLRRRRRRSSSSSDDINIVVSHVYKREAQEMTDVNTSRIIQVVSPGDVNFALNAGNGNNNNETVVVSSQPAVHEKDSICISVASFVAGLVMLLAVLIVACLVAAFLFIRVRALDAKTMPPPFVHTFDAAEFVKVAS